MIKLFAWICDKRVRELSDQLADEQFKNEQLYEQVERLNNELYKTTVAYQNANKAIENKIHSQSELMEKLAEQKEKTAHYVELYLKAVEEKKS